MATKTERLELRLSPDQKRVLERAAAIKGEALSSFVRSQLLERAQESGDRHTRTVLSARDFDRFLRLIDRGGEPAPALKAAFRRHKPRRT